jgi:serine/threonine protein kinase
LLFSDAAWSTPLDDVRVPPRLGVVGSGALGYVVIGQFHGARVALKRLTSPFPAKSLSSGAYDRSADVLRLTDEISAMHRMAHANLLPLRAAVVERSRLCLITPFLSRGSLFGLLHDKSEQVNYKLIVEVGQCIAEGLQALHDAAPQPLVHGGLTSLNVLLKTDGDHTVAQLSDYGLTSIRDSKAHRAAAPLTFHTAHGSVGALLWQPPEVLEGGASSTAADVYAFGIICWEMFSRFANAPILSYDTVSCCLLNARTSHNYMRYSHFFDTNIFDCSARDAVHA